MAANVKFFGAKGNGLEDDSVAFESAMSEAREVFVPPGKYLINKKHGLSIFRPGQTLTGAGDGNTLLIQGPEAKHILWASSIVGEHGNAKTPLNGLHLNGIGFHGRSLLDGFSEHNHLLYLQGVIDVTIENCSFIGFQGDGIYLGFDVTASHVHNKDISIGQCIFDGLNKKNRNGISIIDGECVSISNCVFTRCSSGSMPGSIDIEPNEHHNHYVNNILVEECCFLGSSGSVAHVSLVVQGPGFDRLPKNIRILNNSFMAGNCVALISRLESSKHDFSVSISGNLMSGVDCPLRISGPVHGIIFEQNVISHAKPIILENFGGSIYRNLYRSNIVMRASGMIGHEGERSSFFDYHENYFVNYREIDSITTKGDSDLFEKKNNFFSTSLLK